MLCVETGIERVVSPQEAVVVEIDADGNECCTVCHEIAGYGFCAFCA